MTGRTHAVMRVQHRDLAPGTDLQPVPQVQGGIPVQSMQHQERKGKIVDLHIAWRGLMSEQIAQFAPSTCQLRGHCQAGIAIMRTQKPRMASLMLVAKSSCTSHSSLHAI